MEERIKFIISITFFIVTAFLYIFLSQWEKKINEKNKKGKKSLIIFSKFLALFLMLMSFFMSFPLNYGGIIQDRYDRFIDWIYSHGSKMLQGNDDREKQDAVTTPEPPEMSVYIPVILPTLPSNLTPTPTVEPTPTPTKSPIPEPAIEPTASPTEEPTLTPALPTTPIPTDTPADISEGQNFLEGANLMTYVNQYRTDAGVAALEWNSDLEQTAQNIASMFAVGAPAIVDNTYYVIGRQCNGAKNAKKAVADWMTGNDYIPSEAGNLLNAEFTQMGGALYYLPNGNEYGYHYFWVICLQ